MTEYKLGNKVNCIIRAHSTGFIGDEEVRFPGQPYTILKDIEANLNWKEDNRTANTNRAIWQYNNDSASNLRLMNIPLTNKILNLIFPKSKDLLCSSFKNYTTNEKGEVFLLKPTDILYDVFVYDVNGDLEVAFDSVEENKLTLNNVNSNYLIVYSYEGKMGLSLDRAHNSMYFTLDLELIGNKNDQTSNSWIHINKCALQTTKNMSFNRNMNSIDLEFTILSPSNSEDNGSYLILE